MEDFKAIPIPIRPSDPNWIENYENIVNNVQEMLDLNGKGLGTRLDGEINQTVAQRVYNLTLKEYRYVISQLGFAEYRKAMKNLFPYGPPPKPVRES